MNMQPLPDELLKISGCVHQGASKLLAVRTKFQQHGQSGHGSVTCSPISARSLMTSPSSLDDTTQFNHAPADLMLFTRARRASAARRWLVITYGLGSEKSGPAGFVVLISGGSDPTGGRARGASRLSAILFFRECSAARRRAGAHVNDPKGMDGNTRRRSLDALKKLNEIELSSSAIRKHRPASASTSWRTGCRSPVPK